MLPSPSRTNTLFHSVSQGRKHWVNCAWEELVTLLAPAMQAREGEDGAGTSTDNKTEN